MAGIGFELRKLLRKDTLLGLIRAYAYAGVCSRSRASCSGC